jgi:hypothetical protein
MKLVVKTAIALTFAGAVASFASPALAAAGDVQGAGWTAQASWSVVGGLGDGPRPIDPQLGPVYPKHQGNIVQRPWTDMSYQEQLSRVNALLGGFLTRGVGV